MTTPTGSPAWSRTADATVYGGQADKRDYQAQGVVNPQTDVAADEYKRICADLAAVVRVAPFASLRLTCDDTTPGAPTVLAAFQQTGVTATPYLGSAAPNGFPEAERNGDGDVTITWDANYTDDYGEAAGIEIRFATASLVSSSAGSVSCEIVSATELRVRAFDGSGTALADAGIAVEVWA